MQDFTCNSFGYNILRGTIFSRSLFSIFCEREGGGGYSREHFPKAVESGNKSFECRILRVTRFDTIFCEEQFFLALCFQYFASEKGEGVTLGNTSPKR